MASPGGTDGEANGARGWTRIIVVAAVIVTAALVIRYTGAAEYVTIARLRQFREATGMFAPLVFIAAYILGMLVAFPAIILSLSGGLLFGTLFGGALIIVGASIGALGAFMISRAAGRATVERFVAGRALERFDRTVTGAGLSAVMFTRLVPIFPFSIVNFAWGLTGVRMRDYVIGTVVGIAPAAFIYANIAGSIARSFEGTDASLASVDYSRLINRDVLGAFALLGVLAVVPPLVKYYFRASRRDPKV